MTIEVTIECALISPCIVDLSLHDRGLKALMSVDRELAIAGASIVKDLSQGFFKYFQSFAASDRVVTKEVRIYCEITAAELRLTLLVKGRSRIFRVAESES